MGAVRWRGFAILAGVLLHGCTHEANEADFVARVGSAYLKQDDLLAIGRAADSSSSTLNYINEWISSELLYQEAIRRGIPESDDVSEKVHEARKRIAVDALLREELFRDSASVTDSAVSLYYSSNKEEFVLREDVALMSLALFNDRSAANTFRSSIVRGTSWNEALESASGDSLIGPHLLEFTNRSYYTKTSLYPEELWKLARSMQADRVSFVVRTDPGYYVLLMHEFRRQGEPADLPFVSEEIRNRILIEERRAQYEALLQDLRSHVPVEVRLSSLEMEGPDSLRN